MTERHLIIINTETTSLDTETCGIVEVAAINAATGDTLRFVPYVPPHVLADANPVALQINGYHERELAAEMLGQADTAEQWDRLRQMLVGNTFGGSNPTFDTALVARHVNRFVWHHRLADLAAYTAGALGMPPTELPGLDKSCELLGVVNAAPHTALGDAVTTAACFAAIENGVSS